MPAFSWGKLVSEKNLHPNYLCTHFPRKELIVLYFHNFCAKYPNYEETLSSASYLQRWFPFRQRLILPDNGCQFPSQYGLDGALPPSAALTLRQSSYGPGADRAQQRLRSCSFGCYTAGEKRWTLPRSAYRQKKERHMTPRYRRLVRNDHDVVRVFQRWVHAEVI